MISLIVLLLLTALAGGSLWFLLHPRVATIPNQGHSLPSTIPNQGPSLLFISTSTTALSRTSKDTLTMIRTSDGATLWNYPVPGGLSRSFSWIGKDTTRAGAFVQFLNGIVYFLIDTNPASSPNGSPHRLMALSASDGRPRWQQDLQAGSYGLIAASGGFICLVMPGRISGSGPGSVTLVADRADTGAFAWQHQWSDIDDTSLTESIYAVHQVLYLVTLRTG